MARLLLDSCLLLEEQKAKKQESLHFSRMKNKIPATEGLTTVLIYYLYLDQSNLLHTHTHTHTIIEGDKVKKRDDATKVK
jgi:hypothetical protein